MGNEGHHIKQMSTFERTGGMLNRRYFGKKLLRNYTFKNQFHNRYPNSKHNKYLVIYVLHS
jgi:hypothetical protein